MRQFAPGMPVIEMSGVHLALGAAEILRGIDLVVGCGERVAIIGPSGSGKSSLIRCMNALARPRAGRVTVLGEDLATPAGLKECRRRTDMIFQSFNLYSQMTVLENVMLAPRHLLGLPAAAARARALEHLAAMEMDGFAARYPFELSGGQQQRVALARALAKAPDILLLDEPTSALDPELVRSVMAAIVTATARGITTVTVTHEIGFAREHAHRLVFLCEGRVVEQGPPEDMLARPKSPRLAGFLKASARA
ncbi:amino acid ABC transporter ATP-binding protein [Ancylobacter sp. MQZ15Z-1]|uniref:Amino acid ABC transporter ATP-binding protein n=1 Tax=Ancylobacter mangrovi TaxID=2972472 RepID=A0A9X2PP63_9HYPH|nr:amino acid ABC transporter ATP-binding protein [Ancylobacter mangrovi]MCS0497293.1 amino acid ABC transporter ATP-binding protein [Ancylobacter mangrovi]